MDKEKRDAEAESFRLADIPYPPLKNIYKIGYDSGYQQGMEDAFQVVVDAVDVMKELRKYARHNYSCQSQQYESCDCLFNCAIRKYEKFLEENEGDGK